MNDKPKRIAILHPTMKNHGGAEFVVDKLATELALKGFDLTLFTDFFDYIFWGKEKKYKIQEFKVGLRDYNLKQWEKIGYELSKELEEFDIINPHNFPSYFFIHYAKEKNPNIKSKTIWYCEEPNRVLFAQFTDKNSLKEKLIPKILRIYQEYGIIEPVKNLYYKIKNKFKIIKLDQIIVNHLDLILGNSQFTTNIVKEIYKNNAFPCLLGLIDEYHINKIIDYNDYFFTITRLENLKNVEICIKAVESLYQKKLLGNFKYIIAGKGKQFNSIQKYIKDKKLEKVIELKGFVSNEEKIALLSKTLFCLYLPIDEPFGLVSLESFAFKKSIIVSNHGGLTETVQHGETGLHVDPFDISEIENAILKMINNKNETIKMGEKGYEMLNNNFTFEHFINRFIKMLDNLK